MRAGAIAGAAVGVGQQARRQRGLGLRLVQRAQSDDCVGVAAHRDVDHAQQPAAQKELRRDLEGLARVASGGVEVAREVVGQTDRIGANERERLQVDRALCLRERFVGPPDLIQYSAYQ